MHGPLAFLSLSLSWLCVRIYILYILAGHVSNRLLEIHDEKPFNLLPQSIAHWIYILGFGPF